MRARRGHPVRTVLLLVVPMLLGAAALVVWTDALKDTTHVTAQHTDPKSAIHAWSARGGSSRTAAVGADLGAIDQAAAARDTTALRVACSAMGADVRSAQAYDSIPDAEAQAEWLASLSYLAQASTDCVNGVDTLSGPLIQKMDSEIASATDTLKRATSRINELAAH